MTDFDEYEDEQEVVGICCLFGAGSVGRNVPGPATLGYGDHR